MNNRALIGVYADNFVKLILIIIIANSVINKLTIIICSSIGHSSKSRLKFKLWKKYVHFWYNGNKSFKNCEFLLTKIKVTANSVFMQSKKELDNSLLGIYKKTTVRYFFSHVNFNVFMIFIFCGRVRKMVPEKNHQ